MFLNKYFTTPSVGDGYPSLEEEGGELERF